MLYNDESCDSFIRNYDSNLELLTQGDNSSFRKVYIKSVDINDHIEIIDNLISINEAFYNFDLGNFIEFYFAKYDTNCHYKQEHIDCKPISNFFEYQRKLSFSILLNDEFEGGNFCFGDSVLNKKRGELLTFPSFLPHRVNVITSGIRYVMFGFWNGPAFK